MVNQICIAGLVEGLSEGIHFAKKSGLDVAAVIDTISKGAAQSWQMENRYKTMNDGKFDFGFAVEWMRKDLSICLAEARRNGAPRNGTLGNAFRSLRPAYVCAGDACAKCIYAISGRSPSQSPEAERTTKVLLIPVPSPLRAWISPKRF